MSLASDLKNLCPYINKRYSSFISLHLCLKSQRSKCLILVKFFVCFLVPLENISLIWRRHHCRWWAGDFDQCSALMAIEQWGFFSVPHLLWQGTSVYNGHLRGPVTLSPFAERLAVELLLPVFTTLVCSCWALTKKKLYSLL